MTRSHLALALLLAVPSLGFTECDHFDEVTVPASDTSTPVAGARVMQADGTDEIRFGSAHYDTHDYLEAYNVFPFGYDQGGIRSLRVSQTATARCEQGGIGTIRHFNMPTQVDEITAAPGAVVSNGRYLVVRFDAAQFGGRHCDIAWSWSATATDFAGRTGTATGSVRYSP